MIWPLSGAILPATMLNSVDLPAPFGPISPVIEPRSTLSEQFVDGQEPAKALADVPNVDDCVEGHA